MDFQLKTLGLAQAASEKADALIVQPENDPGTRAGEIVDVIPLTWG